MMTVSMENYNYITSDTEKDKLTGIQYGGLQFQSGTRQLNGNKYGELK